MGEMGFKQCQEEVERHSRQNYKGGTEGKFCGIQRLSWEQWEMQQIGKGGPDYLNAISLAKKNFLKIIYPAW